MRDFHLQSFLVKLLDEQIAAYYDSKTKTVNLLDWIAPETQKPVLAHELTHALQDQRVNLDKWQSQTSDDLSRSYAEDRKHIATDEDDTAREAVLEGQAMAVFVDYSLAPAHRSLRNSPGIIDNLLDTMTDDGDSPVLSRAPLLLQESLLFPYKDGLKFEAALVSDSKNPAAAYADVLDRPPASSYEIMNPHAYEDQAKVALLNMPDIHPVIDAQYNPYDIGVMGELDVRILSELFGGKELAAELTPAWDGGIYYAAQKKDAPDKDSTASVALLYLSQWKSEESAAAFVKMYADELGRKYTHASRNACGGNQRQRAGLRHQRGSGAHRHQRQGRLRERELRPEHGAQTAVPDVRSAAGRRAEHGAESCSRFAPRCGLRPHLRPDRQHGAPDGALRHDEGRAAPPFILIPCADPARSSSRVPLTADPGDDAACLSGRPIATSRNWHHRGQRALRHARPHQRS